MNSISLNMIAEVQNNCYKKVSTPNDTHKGLQNNDVKDAHLCD